MIEGYDIYTYVHEPSGYGNWCGPLGYAKELHQEIEKYVVHGDVQKEKKTYVLTDFYTVDYNNVKCRLYVPKGTTAAESNLVIIKAV